MINGDHELVFHIMSSAIYGFLSACSCWDILVCHGSLVQIAQTFNNTCVYAKLVCVMSASFD